MLIRIFLGVKWCIVGCVDKFISCCFLLETLLFVSKSFETTIEIVYNYVR